MALKLIFSLYLISLLSSIAGMEIFSWTTFLIVNVMLVIQPEFRVQIPVLRNRVFLCAAGLFVWVVLGVITNLNHIPDPMFVIGDMRWVLLFCTFTLTFLILFPSLELIRKGAFPYKKVIFLLIAIGTLISIYAIWQHYSGKDLLRGLRETPPLIDLDHFRYRPYGLFKMTLTYACSFSMFLLIPFCLSFYYLKLKRYPSFIVLLLCSLLMFLSVLATYSRGLWIAVPPALVLCAYFLNRRFALSILGFIGATFIVLALTLPLFKERLLTIVDSKFSSNVHRMGTWEANLLMFRENPVFGVGYEMNGPPVLDEYYAKLKNPEGYRSHAHNNFVNFISGTGLVGLLLYLGFIGWAFKITLNNIRRLKDDKNIYWYLLIASLGAQVVLHLGGLTEYNFGDAEIQHQFITYLAFNLAVDYRLQNSTLKG